MATAEIEDRGCDLEEEKTVTKKKVQRDDRDLTNPVFRKISLLNGEINRYSKPQLERKLFDLEMDTRGDIDVLRKRLKNYCRNMKLIKANVCAPKATSYDYLLVIDFEATCEEDNSSYKHEIIEFPAVLIDVLDCKIVSDFHAYCKPVLNPKLSEFCTQLTGITQEMVDKADTFPTVFINMQKWMDSQGLGKRIKFGLVTDGPWDVSRFLYTQCQLSEIRVPKWCKNWINIRKCFTNFYQVRRVKLETMLTKLGLTFEGRLHCGLDDTRNIARIVLFLLKDGCRFRVNEYFQEVYSKEKGGMIAQVNPVKDNNESERHCKRDKSNHNSTGQPVDKAVSESLKKMSIDSADRCDSISEEEVDDVNDLLDYYKLQRS